MEKINVNNEMFLKITRQTQNVSLIVIKIVFYILNHDNNNKADILHKSLKRSHGSSSSNSSSSSGSCSCCCSCSSCCCSSSYTAVASSAVQVEIRSSYHEYNSTQNCLT